MWGQPPRLSTARRAFGNPASLVLWIVPAKHGEPRLSMSSRRAILVGSITLLLAISQATARTSPSALKPQIGPNTLALAVAPGSAAMKADQVNIEGWNKA